MVVYILTRVLTVIGMSERVSLCMCVCVSVMQFGGNKRRSFPSRRWSEYEAVGVWFTASAGTGRRSISVTILLHRRYIVQCQTVPDKSKTRL